MFFNNIASSIIMEFSFKSFMNKGKTIEVEICAINDAKAAPEAPQIGISIIFKTTLTIADKI